MKKFLNLFVVVAIIFSLINFVQAAENSAEKYQLEKILIFSRHNVRAPTRHGAPFLKQVTNKKWIDWPSKAGELSPRGGIMEISMGQYFKEYLEHENFITDNYIPKEGEFRFYANSYQRTVATTKFFSSGMLPIANVEVEYKYPVNKHDEIFMTQFGKVSESYRQEILNRTLSRYNAKNFQELAESFKPELETLEKMLDLKNSQYAKENHIQHFPTNDLQLIIEPDKDISWSCGIQKASSAADALIMQYYENDFAFGQKFTDKQLQDLKKIHDFAMDFVFGDSEASKILANPALKFLREENSAQGRRFSFIGGHDSNVMPILNALEVEKYNLPDPVEGLTPIGVKIVVEKRIGTDKKEYANIYLLYPSVEQIKNLEILSLKNPPQIFNLSFKNLKRQENGMYLYSDFEKLLNDTIAAGDSLRN